MVIGYNSGVNFSNAVLLGNTNTSVVGSYGEWTTFLSDGRFKKNVQENVKGLDFILQLRPITYHMDISGLNDFLGINPYGNNDSSMTPAMKALIDDAISKRNPSAQAASLRRKLKKLLYNQDMILTG
ncbi:MAG: tail fiber domain-containing protein [Chitinophagaceae bacterium]|nr:tail fiber domain-containing protein [Chitinophagaceae bacterium]